MMSDSEQFSTPEQLRSVGLLKEELVLIKYALFRYLVDVNHDEYTEQVLKQLYKVIEEEANYE